MDLTDRSVLASLVETGGPGARFGAHPSHEEINAEEIQKMPKKDKKRTKTNEETENTDNGKIFSLLTSETKNETMYGPGIWAAPDIWASTDSEPGDVNSVSATGDECRVCPVGVGSDGEAGLGLGLAGLNPIMHYLAKGIKIPMFDDAAEDWPSFMWDFREFLQKLSPGKEIADAYKLGLLEQAITPTLRGEIKLLRKRNGGTVTYPEVLARFEARYSSGGVAKLRKKWNEVTMNTNGKISSKQLREFQVNFLSCADYVKDTTPQEVRRVLMQKLPSWMKTWVAEAEQKKERNRPIVQIAAVEGMTEESMKRSIKKLIGEPPIKTQCMGGNVYRVTFNDYELAKKIACISFPQDCRGGPTSANLPRGAKF